MSEDRRKVLEMVASGRVSVDDGERLLDALGRDEAPLRPVRPVRPGRVRADVRVGRRRMRFGAFPGFDVMAELGGGGERFIEGLREAFGEDLDVEGVIEMRDHGVRPDYAIGMRDAFGERLDREDLITLKDHSVSVAFAAAACDAFDDIAPEEVVTLRDHGVGASFIVKMRDALGDEVDVDELVRLRDHGVTPKYAVAVRAALGDDVSLDDIVRLRDRGVSVGDLGRHGDLDEDRDEVVDADIEPDE